MLEERTGVFAAGDNKLTLLGPEVKVGDKAPGFTVSGAGLKQVSLADSAGKVRIIASVPSLDTGVCSEETQKFNELASSLPDDVVILTVSMDLPFAQARWCGASGCTKVQCLSDHRDVSFGEAYGVLTKELRLLARSIFVINPDGKVQYVEYVKEVTEQPDYEKALNALKRVAQA